MSTETDFLESLDHKVDQVVALCGSLHAENESLRAQVAALEADKQSLLAKMATARTRLEALKDKLPEA